jgi:hypothetical protein
LNKIVGNTKRVVQVLTLALFTALPFTSHAHLLGLAWNDIGNNTVRFYGETAHDLAAMGLTEESDTFGGGLQIGPFADHQDYVWTGIEIGATFEELGIDGYAYWDYLDDRTTIGDYHPDSHRGGPGSSGDFFFVDVENFVSGDYILQAFNTRAVERPVSWTYLHASIAVQDSQEEEVSSVPEPSSIALLGLGLLGVWVKRRASLAS